MKKLFILASAVFAFNAVANEINCESLTAKVVLDNKNVTIESKSIPLNDELRAFVLNTTGVSDANGAVNVGIKITFPKKDLDCSKPIARVFSCNGKTKRAQVSLDISQKGNFGYISNIQTQRSPVKIENIQIQTSVGANGPIVIGSEPTTVELNQLKVNSSMFIKMNNGFQLDLEQNFENSLCK